MPIGNLSTAGGHCLMLTNLSFKLHLHPREFSSLILNADLQFTLSAAQGFFDVKSASKSLVQFSVGLG